ncbi:MAG: iron ABC transporter permease [SAR202 cluster bacterium]|nr:iron ABC transporter permease [SAR202 cluster bacterium]|tara:strand:+ start:1452 stop:2423 length:972 start_codon:yes stop_codon:yes gene_type:complete
MRIFFPWFIIFALIGLLSLAGIFAGVADVNFNTAFKGLINPDDSIISTIIWKIRLPRVVVSLIAGACLGLSGSLIQFSTRSPLGDANLFGIGGGSTIFLALGIAGIISLNGFTQFLAALFGALAIAWLLNALIASKNLTPTRLILMGIAVGSLTIAIAISIVSHGRVFPTQVIGLVAGSFTTTTWEVAQWSSLSLIICLIISILIARNIGPLILGDVLSRSLGIRPRMIRAISMTLVGVLAGTSVYSGGLIAFVGLVSPHLARRIYGNKIYSLIIGSTIIGSFLVLLADQIARLLLAPTELPVGLTTTLIGAPIMIYLAARIK